MSIDSWWPKLDPRTREWLIANNGDAVPPDVVDEVAQAGGPGLDDGWWLRSVDGPPEIFLPDEASDWIDAVANGETPEVE